MSQMSKNLLLQRHSKESPKHFFYLLSTDFCTFSLPLSHTHIQSMSYPVVRKVCKNGFHVTVLLPNIHCRRLVRILLTNIIIVLARLSFISFLSHLFHLFFFFLSALDTSAMKMERKTKRVALSILTTQTLQRH